MQTHTVASLDTCLVRILTAAGTPVGVGCLVADSYLCTCAHVVADALGIPRDTALMPESAIQVDFPLIAPGQVLTAHPVFWQPAEQNGKGDIVGLELDMPLPPGAAAAQLISATDLWQHPFRAFGFPQGYDSGVWASGRMLGRQALGWVLIEAVKETGYRVEPGFSGTPVWDEQLQGVVGIVVAAERRSEIKAAFVIPVSLLIKAWPAVLKASNLPAGTPRLNAAADGAADDPRTHMLDKVETFWVKRLLTYAQSQPVQVMLQLEYAPDLVVDPLAEVVEQPIQARYSIAPDKPMIDVFDELSGELLIVGAPGAGKTRLLLELAVALIDRARMHTWAAIPVVFNLSTWSVKRSALDQWLVAELNQRYDVPRRLARRWVAAGAILPLLDGLDEVEADARERCVDVINAFRHARGGLSEMAVCCRDADYKQLNTKLRLGGAIAIRALTLEEAKLYLGPLERQVDSVREALDGDVALWEILDTPLMLNLVVSAYAESPPQDTPKSAMQEARRHQLFDDYIAAMLKRPGRSRSSRMDDPDQMLFRLGWLARQMLAHRQQTFLLEQIDTTLLANWRWRSIYHILLRVAGTLLFLITCSLIGALATAANPNGILLQGLIRGLELGWKIAFALVTASLLALRLPKLAVVPLTIGVLTIGLAYLDPTMYPTLDKAAIDGLIFGLPGSLAGLIFTGRGSIQLVDAFRWTRPRFWRGLGLGLTASFTLAIVFSILTNNPVAGITFGLLLGACCTLPVLLFQVSKGDMIEPLAIPNQAIRRSLRTATVIFGVLLCTCVLIGTLWGQLVLKDMRLQQGLAFGLIMGIPIGLVAALAGGGAASLQHYLLRAVLATSGVMTWRYQRFLDYATDRMFLRRVGSGYNFYHRLLMEHFAKIAIKEQDHDQ